MNHDRDVQGSRSWESRLAVLLLICGVALVVVVSLNIASIDRFLGYGLKRTALSGFGLLSVALGIYLKFRHEGPPMRPSQLLVMSIWFGLLTGIGDVLILGVKVWFLNFFFNFNPHWVWMQPAANLLLFALIGLVLSVIAWRWPNAISMRFASFGFFFLMFLGWIIVFPQLHILAQLLLVTGLAVTLSGLVATYSQQFTRLVGRTIIFSGALVASLFIGFYVWKVVPGQIALANLPSSNAKTPNVLFIVMDTVRAESLSLHGYDRETSPNLDRLAESGVIFDRAVATSPWTLPSHASMFTGRLPHELFAEWETPLDAETPVRAEHRSLAEVLSEQGYATAGFVANVGFCSCSHGLNRGFTHYEDYVFSIDSFVNSSSLIRKIYKKYRRFRGDQDLVGRKSAADVNRAFLNWLSRRPKRPFFAFLNYFDPHDPYLPPAPFDTKFGEKPDIAHVRHDHEYSVEEINQLRNAYDGSIAYLDHQIGALMDNLRDQGLLDDTIVIITSDHGEQFGEHGLMYHSNSLYSQLLHVPLVIAFPQRVPPNKRVAEPVSLRDLPATVLDLIDNEQDPVFPGSSLARFWDNRELATIDSEALVSEILIRENKPTWWPKFWPVEKGGMKSVVSQGHHLIREGDGSEQLYDFKNDPKETKELSDSKNQTQLLESLRLLINEMFQSN